MTATLDRPVEAAREPWRQRLQPLAPRHGGWLATLVVALVAALLRFVRVDLPATTLNAQGVRVGPGKIFDEIYYACDAQNLLRYGVEHATVTGNDRCVPTGGGAFVVHPPLGKWLIAAGEQLFGVNTVGWRSAAALFGVLTVLVTVRVGRRMTGSTLLGATAGLLLSFDGLHFVQSRVAMLDVFLCFFVLATFACLVVDRDRVRERLSVSTLEQVEAGGRTGGRRWLVLAGVMLGCALATKWSALYAAGVLLPLAVGWEAAARRTAGVRAPWRTTLRHSSVPVLAALVVLPVVVYVASWTGWFVTDLGWDRHWADTRGTVAPYLPKVVRSFWHYHAEIFHFHSTLRASHPYQSHPLTWPILQRPVSYYYPSKITVGTYGCTTRSCAREVLAIGTPALWWAMIPAALLLAARWVAHRDWRASSLLLMVLAGVLPWEVNDLQHRTMFLFYALPAVPFLCLGIALLLGWALGQGGRRRLVGAAAAGAYVALVVVNFFYLYPVLAAVTIPYSQWGQRMWFPSWI